MPWESTTVTEPKDKQTRDKFEENAKRVFAESVESLDASRLSALNRARHRALDELEQARGATVWQRLLPVSGVAVAAVLVTVLVLRTNEPLIEVPGVEMPQAQEAGDFEILVTEDSLEMLEELEFYSWLELAEAGDSDQQI